jgi:glycosyltransferase involved in cell wall biosynthesis
MSDKSILILTQYYPPEVGAPQNRLHELAVRLQAKGIKVDVLTAMPNYPKMVIDEAYRNGKIKEEIIDGVQVYRSKIFVSNSKKIIPRLLNYFSFVWTSYWRGRKLGKYDFLMVESPPLFLGYSAMRLSKKLNAKLIFNVSDLWPESAEKMGIVSNQQMLRMAYKLEEKCYKRSSLVTGQTMGIVNNIKERFPNTQVHWLPNGVDLDFYDPKKIAKNDFRLRNNIHESDIVFFYGGIIGHAQGLETVLRAAKLLESESNVKIVLQGAGPEKEYLQKLNSELGLSNVLFLPPVQKSEMPSILAEVDVALVPLRKLDLFQGAIPSKIFEALAMQKALLLGVDGEAKIHFIDKAKAGYFFEPENSNDLAEKMRLMAKEPNQITEMGVAARAYVTEHFNRNNIANDFIAVLNNN